MALPSVEYTQDLAVDAFFVAGYSVMHHHPADIVFGIFNEVQGGYILAVAIFGTSPSRTRKVFGYDDTHDYFL